MSVQTGGRPITDFDRGRSGDGCCNRCLLAPRVITQDDQCGSFSKWSLVSFSLTTNLSQREVSHSGRSALPGWKGRLLYLPDLLMLYAVPSLQ